MYESECLQEQEEKTDELKRKALQKIQDPEKEKGGQERVDRVPEERSFGSAAAGGSSN